MLMPKLRYVTIAKVAIGEGTIGGPASFSHEHGMKSSPESKSTQAQECLQVPLLIGSSLCKDLRMNSDVIVLSI